MNNFRGQGAGRSKYLDLSSLQSRILSVVALCGMYGWFLYGILMPPGDPYFVSIFLNLLGFGSALVLVLSAYGFVAMSHQQHIDERELQQRNAACFHAYIYVLALVSVGCILGKDIARVPPETFANFMWVALASSFIMPATLLAWRDDGG